MDQVPVVDLDWSALMVSMSKISGKVSQVCERLPSVVKQISLHCIVMNKKLAFGKMHKYFVKCLNNKIQKKDLRCCICWDVVYVEIFRRKKNLVDLKAK